jgi:hypothetical protein
MATSNITLAATNNWTKRFVWQRPLNNGNSNEPALTSANIVLQTILGAPFSWRWNRAVIGFVAQQGQQDYTIFSWQATTVVSKGYVLIDSNGYSQQVTVGGTTGSTIPTFNSTVGGTTTDGSVTWTNSGSLNVTNFSTSYSFAWIEHASIQAMNPNTCAAEWKEIEPKLKLALDSAQSRPAFIDAQYQDSNGNITFRLMPVPDKSYPVSITIQQKPPIMTGMNSLWTPIPDEYSRLYSWGFLALMYMFADDPRFQIANQKFIANLLNTNQGLTQTQLNIFLNNWEEITGHPITNIDKLQQGFQGRASI